MMMMNTDHVILKSERRDFEEMKYFRLYGERKAEQTNK